MQQHQQYYDSTNCTESTTTGTLEQVMGITVHQIRFGCREWCTVIPITCPSAPLVVDSVHLYCYSIVDAVAFLLVILLIDSFPHIKLAYLALFSLLGFH